MRDSSGESASSLPSELSAGKHWLRRLVAWITRGLLIAVALYLTVVVVGLVPVNNDFQPTADGIEIHVVSNAVHADIVMPLESSVINWRDVFPKNAFPADTSGATHIAIGWGDKGFFLQTPRWADLKLSVAAKALLWNSGACNHVSMTNAHYVRDHGRSVKISTQQYQRLVAYIQSDLERDANGRTILIADAGYKHNDAFFEAKGNYHALNTCNSWAGRGLKAAGIRTGWMTP
ncbi:MAG: TIGR02117 family protein, partial [Pirellulaceae bacterium]|nr:TIGR02117 family protein [Pirellulaceae bacterium]